MEYQTEILNHLKEHLKASLPREKSDIYSYCVLPPGKLFRPHLVWATALDLEPATSLSVRSNHAYLASAVEIHHAYTLVHDDLPCMDNDSTRRGKPSAHIAFGQWQALLAGDGLLNVSYQVLAQIDSPNLGKILRLITKFLGPKGLILGQVKDLSGEMTKSFKDLLETHNLKTGRLIQASILSSYLLTETVSYRVFLDLFKLGYKMGIVFQLFDDLTEFTENELSVHEKEVNPWFKYSSEARLEIEKGMDQIDRITAKHGLNNLNKIIVDYYQNILNKLEGGRENLQKNGIEKLTSDTIFNFIGHRNH